MDVLNFAHGGLFALGAYSGTWIYTIMAFKLVLLVPLLQGFYWQNY